MYLADILYAGADQGHRANKLLASLEPEDFACLRARPEKGLSGQGSHDSKRVLKPNLEARDVDPDHSAAV
jgi:hypothetical protein